jgi:hypothetical protein
MGGPGKRLGIAGFAVVDDQQVFRHFLLEGWLKDWLERSLEAFIGRRVYLRAAFQKKCHDRNAR